MKMIKGAYAMLLASPDYLYAFRDPNGIRPLVVGKLSNGRGWVFLLNRRSGYRGRRVHV